MRHRGTEFDVEDGPSSWWHGIIYPEAGPDIIGENEVSVPGGRCRRRTAEITTELSEAAPGTSHG